jgi:hypothetical protein
MYCTGRYPIARIICAKTYKLHWNDITPNQRFFREKETNSLSPFTAGKNCFKRWIWIPDSILAMLC